MLTWFLWRQRHIIIEPVHEISNNVVCATSNTSDQPALTSSLIRAFATRLSILWLLATDWTPFGVSRLKRRLQRLVWVCTCQNATLLQISRTGSILLHYITSKLIPEVHQWSVSTEFRGIGPGSSDWAIRVCQYWLTPSQIKRGVHITFKLILSMLALDFLL